MKKTAEVLNDLIKINNDRIAGYEKAIAALPAADVDLKALFSGLIEQSQMLKDELQQHISAWEDRVDDQTTASGKIYRAWMDVKQTFAIDDRKAILESCEFGEDAAQKAYREAEEEEEISTAAKALISSQKTQLRASHDQIKQLRDREKAVND
ncbi:MAG TPA: PA2169 family four-helix-bundle protein [Parapedobacter sp.]|uniref:PA2169 family four-helix-bundle protein n=1 Tax=Parapedobacter sp. TaxID=1958893 RepID=UPI002B82530D|nr:PA2169 family four-helix-bundle protein [Parapedobacter sp.]HWK59422.1 PA2169 family four-helix-bundle protein [Parapedobacter sp.]